MAPPSSPAVLRTAESFRAACDAARAAGARVALVPTMGPLHDGHLALVAEARRRVGPDGFVALSIFVNPTQFGPTEDLAAYPRDLDGDLARCASAGVDAVFAPEAAAMYPPGDETRVRVGALTEGLCGAWRPGHFEGVATVVTKLFALAGPCVAVFGRKDSQQWRVVRRLACDLWLPVEVVGLATAWCRTPARRSRRSPNSKVSGRRRPPRCSPPPSRRSIPSSMSWWPPRSPGWVRSPSRWATTPAMRPQIRERAAKLGGKWTPVMVEQALWAHAGGKAGR